MQNHAVAQRHTFGRAVGQHVDRAALDLQHLATQGRAEIAFQFNPIADLRLPGEALNLDHAPRHAGHAPHMSNQAEAVELGFQGEGVWGRHRDISNNFLKTVSKRIGVKP